MFQLTDTLIAELQTMDTPTVCNALELLVPQRRGYGYTSQPLVCTRPQQKPMVGIARTATMTCSSGPKVIAGALFLNSMRSLILMRATLHNIKFIRCLAQNSGTS